jgi:hypothetical protein
VAGDVTFFSSANKSSEVVAPSGDLSATSGCLWTIVPVTFSDQMFELMSFLISTVNDVISPRPGMNSALGEAGNSSTSSLPSL